MGDIQNPTPALTPVARPLRALAVLAGVLTALGVVVAPLAYLLGGGQGLAAAALAWAVALAGGLAALVVSLTLRHPKLVVQQTLLAMGLRTALPLAICLVLIVRESPLVEAGVVYYVLLFYLTALTVDTLLLLVAIPRAAARSVESS